MGALHGLKRYVITINCVGSPENQNRPYCIYKYAGKDSLSDESVFQINYFETFCEHSDGTKQGTGQDIYVKGFFCTLKVICRNFLSEIHSHLVWCAILYDIIIVNHVYCMIDMDTFSSCHPFSVPHLVYSSGG